MSSSFHSFSHVVDKRVLRALTDLGFTRPTPIQEKAIPLALSESRDILARAPTGSGKTIAYCVPVLQKILTVISNSDASDPTQRATRALIFVPTRELAEQVSGCLRSLIQYLDGQILVSNVTSGTVPHLEKSLLSDQPDIVVATPSRALSLLRSKSLDLQSLDTLVIDEADLILSYGHDEDARTIFTGSYLPSVYQSILMSATMSEDVEMLKGLVLRDPISLMLSEAEEDELVRLSQYYVNCPNGDKDKFLLTYIILKLKLIAGKTLLFVNDVDRCYRLKLFLEQFSIRSCVLNSELPLNSRYHTVQEFNKGVYDYIIATDEGKDDEDSDSVSSEKEDGDSSSEEEEQEQEEEFLPAQREEKSENEDHEVSMPSSRKRPTAGTPPPSKRRKIGSNKGKLQKQDREFGVTRGIDFVDVACVVNFDLPISSRGYTHRIGRTARAGKSGTAISFVVPASVKEMPKWPSASSQVDEKVWPKILASQARKRGLVSSDSVVKEYKFDAKQINAFKYRMEDALRSVTRKAIKEARIKELKNEVLHSSKLKAHFEDNPLDLEYLRHDKPLHPTRVQAHMKFVPKYLMPQVASVQARSSDIQGEASTSSDVGFVPFKKQTNHSRGGRGGRGGSRGRSTRGRKKDPLRTFRR